MIPNDNIVADNQDREEAYERYQEEVYRESEYMEERQ